MNTQQLRELFSSLENQYILNDSFVDDGEYHVLAMLGVKDGQLCLWEFCAMPTEEEEAPPRIRRVRTNREELKNNALEKNAGLHIREIVIDGHSFSVCSASGTCLGEMCNHAEWIFFSYMLQKGVFLGELEQIPLERLTLNCYELQQPEDFCFDTLDKIEEVTVKIDPKFIPMLVNKRLVLKTGAKNLPRKLYLKQYDMNIYINNVEYYDIWEDAATKFDDARYTERFSPEELAEMKRQYMEMLPDVCPKGMVLPMIEYETDNDGQVQFYTQEYLRRAPKHNSTSSFLLFHSGKKEGPNGHRCRTCELEPVEKGFAGDIPVELFLYYRQIPEKTVECRKIDF